MPAERPDARNRQHRQIQSPPAAPLPHHTQRHLAVGHGRTKHRRLSHTGPPTCPDQRRNHKGTRDSQAQSASSILVTRSTTKTQVNDLGVVLLCMPLVGRVIRMPYHRFSPARISPRELPERYPPCRRLIGEINFRWRTIGGLRARQCGPTVSTPRL
jgi:hypothetical protein